VNKVCVALFRMHRSTVYEDVDNLLGVIVSPRGVV